MTTPDYIPNNLLDAIRYFEDLDVANEFMARLRWPEGVTCPHCGGKEHSFITTRRTWACKNCKQRFTVKVGTVMEDSPIGLDKWIVAMWLLADCKNGISSHEVARHLKISQKSAWFLMHRIRLAMQRGSWEKFDGQVEADETFIVIAKGVLSTTPAEIAEREREHEAKKAARGIKKPGPAKGTPQKRSPKAP